MKGNLHTPNDAGRFFTHAVDKKALSSVRRLDSGWGVLLDAGEGSWGSLVRMYGHKAAFDQVLHREFLHINLEILNCIC